MSESIQSKKEWWDERMDELKTLVVENNYKLKDLAIHFNKPAGAIASMLHRREISLVRLRYEACEG